MPGERAKKVAAVERSGILHPSNVDRFSARWIAPAEDLRDVIDTYWTAEWHLPDGEAIDQRIIDHPSITLSIERGQVLAPFVVSSVRAKAWRRTITGTGDVFALRLRPAGVAVLTDLDPTALSGERALTSGDHRARRLLEAIGETSDTALRTVRADELIRERFLQRPLTRQQRLANAAIDLLTARPQVRPLEETVAALQTSSRTLHRALARTVGRGPAEIARRIRLQEVVRRLSSEDASISEVAAELGYTDQAHLTNEFRTVTGMTPGGYLGKKM
ncbi:AraC-like DNA-binding protein [Rathayibacter sp. PhB152]|uniref:helix-turn-helix domain-containing protein n=1 Tax=Rathayibacter sp. PhB152 TaxID=2485190 RepID=UPI000F4B8E76|nr:AraC family transcriptional regulator [Rathayibacter sp. PhB152]ROQ52651.1 AraC-like DNA-binding protein [Rathayibacter sp. PhB152]